MNNNSATQIAKGGRRRSYMVLCYARMRIRMPEGAWFTRSDYHQFQDGKISFDLIRNYTRRLTDTGLLEQHPNGIMWRITPTGLQTIPLIDRKFSELNPHGNSDTKTANIERHKRLLRQEDEMLNRIASKVPHLTK